MIENRFIPQRFDAANPPPGGAPPNPPNAPFAIAPKKGRSPFTSLNKRALPAGMDRETRQGANDELLFVQADPPTVARTVNAFEGNPPPPPTPPPEEEYFEEGVGTDRFVQVMAEPEAVADIRRRFRRRPPDPANYTGVRRWFLERPVVQRIIVDYERSRTWNEILAAAVLGGAVVLAGVLGYSAIDQATSAPEVTRINLSPLQCYNAPEGSVAIGYNLSVNGQTLGSDPNTGLAVLISPDQNPLTQTKQVCSGNQPAAIDIVNGDQSALYATFTSDEIYLMQSGCVGNKGCANVVPFRR